MFRAHGQHFCVAFRITIYVSSSWSKFLFRAHVSNFCFELMTKIMLRARGLNFISRLHSRLFRFCIPLCLWNFFLCRSQRLLPLLRACSRKFGQRYFNIFGLLCVLGWTSGSVLSLTLHLKLLVLCRSPRLLPLL